MAISNVWKRRLAVMGRGAACVAFVVVVVSSSISGIGTLWRFFFPPQPPPIAEVTRQVINETDPVKAFAVGCVKGLLAGTASSAANLARCFPGGHPYKLPTTAAMMVSNPVAWAVKRQPSSGDITVYGVIVQIDEQPSLSAPATTVFYQLPVAVNQGKGIEAIDRIGRVDPPPPGVYVALGYPATIPTSSGLFSMLSGFVAAFLTRSGGLERFTTTDSGIVAVGGYSKATLTTAQAENDPPKAPGDNTELAVHIDVSARRSDYIKLDELSYALTLRSVGGTWFVAQIDAIPVLADTTPVPATPAPG